MGPKYEFIDEILNWDSYLLHQIRRLSDGKLGGWIETEDNLSQEGNCWVYDNAKVYGDAKVYGNAKIFGHAQVYDNAQVYSNACVSDIAKVYGNAKVFGDAKITGYAQVYGNAKVYDKAWVGGNAKVYRDAKVFGNDLVNGVELTGEKYDEDLQNKDLSKEVIQDFIYKVDESNKLTIGTSYDSIDDFFIDNSEDSYRSHEAIVVLTVDTKMPIIVLEKAEIKDKKVFRFIVDITNEDGDTFNIKSTIDSKEKFNQLLQSTLDALKQYPQFSKYIEELENVK